MKVDLSIGQRLTIGFALLLAIVVGLMVGVSNWHEASARAQDEFSARVVPLSEHAATLERRVFSVAISLRDYLLSPQPERVDHYTAAVDSVRETLRALHEFEKPALTDVLYREMAPLVYAYLLQADRAMAERGSRPLAARAELELSAARQRALGSIRAFSEYQAAEAEAALAEMASARESVARGLGLAALTALLCFIVLGILITQSVRGPARALLRVARGFEGGDWRHALAYASDARASGAPATRNEMAQLARAFGAAAQALERREQRLYADAQVAAASACSLEKEEIGRAALRAIMEHVSAEAAVVYVADGAWLRPIANHALEGLAEPVAVGMGIPGQAARDRRLVLVSDIPRDAPFRIHLGYDEAPPRAVAALPIVLRDELTGVLVIASLREFDEAALSFLRNASAQLAVGLQNAIVHAEVERLLGEVSRTNARIEAQNTELQAQNEEIQAQDEEIQAQSEEIRAQNEQLREQTDALRLHAQQLSEVDDKKNRFLAVLAHELRNPMAPITNALYLLKRALPGSEQAARAQTLIGRQVDHLKRLIDDLLDVTRISEGKITLQHERLDLARIARECIDDQRSAAEQRGIALELDVPGGPVWIDADETRMAQVVGNLTGNALKFSDAGKRVIVHVAADLERREAVLAVKDEGIGVDPAQLHKLFEPFAQAESTLARSNGGLGLGLSLVKALVDLHGGRVEARSDGAGQGAQFFVRVPLCAPPQSAQNVEPGAPAASASACASSFMSVEPFTASRRVLVVEDNEDAAQSLAEALGLQGHDVLVAGSGPEALEKCAAFQPRVVLCDIGLPGLDGYGVARALRARQPAHELLLVALTGYASESDRQRAAQAGFDLHLAKPVSIERLTEMIALLDAPAAARQMAH